MAIDLPLNFLNFSHVSLRLRFCSRLGIDPSDYNQNWRSTQSRSNSKVRFIYYWIQTAYDQILDSLPESFDPPTQCSKVSRWNSWRPLLKKKERKNWDARPKTKRIPLLWGYIITMNMMGSSMFFVSPLYCVCYSLWRNIIAIYPVKISHFSMTSCLFSNTSMTTVYTGKIAAFFCPRFPAQNWGCGNLSRCRLPPVIYHSTLAYVCHYPGSVYPVWGWLNNLWNGWAMRGNYV